MFEQIIKHGTLTAVIVLIVCVIGVFAAFRIPVQMIPDLEVRTITVETRWSGATPQDVEKEILIEQEEFLRTIPSLTRLIATATFGRAQIELEFPFDVDITETLIRVNNALNQVPSYPENVDQPRISSSSFSSNAFMFLRVTPLEGNPRSLNLNMMRDFLDQNVRTRLETIQGISRVSLWSGAERQIQIMLDLAALANRNITITDVRDAIRNRNRDISGGEVESGKRRFLIRTIGRFQDVASLETMIIARRDNSLVRLGDVAEIRFSHNEVARYFYVDGDPAVGMAVRREAGSNVIDIKYAVIDEIAALNRELLNPAGLELELTAEDAGYVEASIRNVWKNLAIGAFLATLVLFLFLRSGRATMAGIMGIPICCIAAFLGLGIFDRTINVISLAGIAFAIGMTFDNTIVVLESIDKERRKGLSQRQAALSGIQAVWPAVLASSFTTVLVFIPVVFIQEEAGQLYSDVAIAVSAAIIASMIVAMTLVPTLAGHVDFRSVGSGGSDRNKVTDMVDWLIEGRVKPWACIVVTILVSAFIIFVVTPPASYLPEGEEPKAFASMTSPPGYNLDTMEEIGMELQDYFLPYVGADPAVFDSGEADVPAMKYMNLSITPERIRIITETVDHDHLRALMAKLAEKFEGYPGMRAFVTQGSIITSNNGGTRSVELEISGPDLLDIYAVANSAYARARQVFDRPRLRASPSTLSLSQPLVEVRPDWERAAELGVSARDLGFLVASVTDGAYVDEFLYDDDKIDIYFYRKGHEENSLENLSQVPIHTPNGSILPLSAMAEVAETVDTNNIRRINGRRTVTLSIIPPDEIPLETGVEMVREELLGAMKTAGEIPFSVNVDISGASDQLQATKEALWQNYVVAVIIIYLLLVSIFTHWGYPLLIMTTIPVGIAGGIVGLQLMNIVGGMMPFVGLEAIRQPFDMISMLGFLILMGTVVNNPILIVHRAMDSITKAGMNARDAVSEAVRARLRPIAMSTVTTICGLAPLVFLPGAGAELYRGVGAIVMFGILGAAIVTLTFLPALTVVVAEQWPAFKNRQEAAEIL